MTTTLSSNVSAEFLKARDAFAAWYDAKPEEVQFLIDEICELTCFIHDEDEYDKFIALLGEYGITTVEQFESAFYAEYEGYGSHIYTKFAEDFCNETGLNADIPDLFVNAIDYELVYCQSLQYDFFDFDFNENRYFFKKVY